MNGLTLSPLQVAIVRHEGAFLDFVVALDALRRDVDRIAEHAWGDDRLLAALVLVATECAEILEAGLAIVRGPRRIRDGRLRWLRRRIAIVRRSIGGSQ